MIEWLRTEFVFWAWCRWRGHGSFALEEATYLKEGRPDFSVRTCLGCNRMYPDDVTAACDAMEADLDASTLTPEQEKALIEAATKRAKGFVDAWERLYTDEEQEDAAYMFLAGVRWAQKEKR